MSRRVLVTDHALLRYLERVVGINVASHRRTVEDLVAPAVERGASALIHDGHRYVLRAERVTTITPRHHEPGARMTADDDLREG